MIVKAQRKNLTSELPIVEWDSTEMWAQREKYFLFLRDHPLRYAWKPHNLYNALFVNDLLDYNKFCSSLSQLDVVLEDFKSIHNQWRVSNCSYIDPVVAADDFVNNLCDDPITDLWTQSIVYYQI